VEDAALPRCIKEAQNNKAEHTKGIILRQLGHLDLLRPAAFRPRLTTGLALSGNLLFIQAVTMKRVYPFCIFFRM
jgi:hypothetical protein